MTELVEVTDNGPMGGSMMVDLAALLASPMYVVPSDADPEWKSLANYVCTGADDDIVITQALNNLPFNGGEVKLIQGNYHLGVTATSFIDGFNTKGGLTLEGSGRRQGAIIHVPAGSAAPCAVKMAASQGGSQTVRNLMVAFDNPTGTYTHGIWMQSAEAQVYDCVVNKSSGNGIMLDGEPTTRGATPSQFVTSGTVRGCEVQQAGFGCSTATQGQGADGFVSTGLHENANYEGCFVNGGNGSAAGCLGAALTLGTAYTSLTVTPLTGAITNGDQLVIQTMLTTPPTRQIVTASADAAVGATTVNVTSFVANFSYTAAPTVIVANYSKMQTRSGFAIAQFAHLTDCHPYFCYQSGLEAQTASVEVKGGEYETNGWVNMHIQGSLIAQTVHNSIVGVHTYGNPAYCSVFAFGCLSMSMTGNYIDGGLANNAIALQSCNSCTISDNTVTNGVTGTGFSNQCFGISAQSCNDCAIIGNTVRDNLTITGNRFGISTFSCTNMVVVGNPVKVTSGTAISNASTTGTSKFAYNPGYNPVGVVTVAVPATTVAVTAVPYDRVFYVTAGTGTTTVAISGGPTITLTPSALNTIRVPAGTTLTPTYTAAPTWVIEGE